MRLPILIACTATMGGALLAIALLRGGGGASTPAASADAPAAVPTTGPVPAGAAPAPAAPPSAAGSNAARVNPGEPGVFAGFAQWSAAQRQSATAGVMGQTALDLDVLAFLSAELDDRHLDLVSRNNVANALIAQERGDPALAGRLLAMVDDPAESADWRDYALQHAARAAAFGDALAAVVARTAQLAAPGAGVLRGTALLQLDRMDREFHLAGAGEALASALPQALADGGADSGTRLAAIGLVGARGERAFAPHLRALLGTATTPDLMRVVLAALGAVGDRSDEPRVSGYLHHAHPLVALSARTALDRLRATPPSGG